MRIRPLVGTLALALAVLPLTVGPSAAGAPLLTPTSASAGGDFIAHESTYWTWSAPKGWRVSYSNDEGLALSGPAVPGGLTASVEHVDRKRTCVSGSSWDQQVVRYFRNYRQGLRDRGWTIAKASPIFHPKNTVPSLRRQKLQLGRGAGLEIADYNKAGVVDGVPTCRERTLYRDNNVNKFTRDGVARIKAVLTSIKHK